MESKKARRKLKRNVYQISDAQAITLIEGAMNAGVLVLHSFGKWGNRKKMADELMEQAFGDKRKAVRAVQDLVKRDEWNNVVRPMNQAKSWLRKYHSKPWITDAVDWVDREALEEIEQYFQEKKRECLENFQVFKEKYPQLEAAFAEEFPELYSPDNYPPIEYLENSLRFEWYFQEIAPPMSENGDRVRASKVSPQLIAEQNARWREHCKTGMEYGMEKAREAFLEIWAHLRDVLVDPTKKFKDSTIEKPKEFLRRMADIPFFADKPFEELAKSAEHLLTGVEAQDLREDEDYRKIIGSAVDEVVGQFQDLPIVEIDRAIDF
jgi:hypothetical protein